MTLHIIKGGTIDNCFSNRNVVLLMFEFITHKKES